MRLNQTQRNYMIKELTTSIQAQLTLAAKQLTPGLYQQQGVSSIFSVDTRYSRDESEQFTLLTAYGFGWVSDNVCEKMSEIRKKLLSSFAVLPTSWYEEEHAAGNYEVQFDFEGCINKARMGQPTVKVIWHNRDKALATLRRKASSRVNTAIQQSVEGYQRLNELVVDANKYLTKARKRIMLSNVDGAETLLESLQEGWVKVSK